MTPRVNDMSSGTGPERAIVPGRRPFQRGWLIGSSISLIWTFPTLLTLWEEPGLAPRVLGTAIVVVFAALFMATAPLARITPSFGRRLIPPVALFALSVALWPWLGTDVRWLWTFVGVSVAVSRVGSRTMWTTVGILSGLSFAVGEWSGADTFTSVLNSAIILSISIMMFSFMRNISTLERLRDAQAQIAELAAEKERGRVARDVHDILGHSLTVITVKAELAGRLMDAGSPAARDEITQIEQLARGALSDVRTTVHAGWVVREAVTNVIRHSGATACRVRLDGRSIEVADDGCGPSSTASTGSGLTGLRERVETSGARLTVGRNDLGGFTLKVAW